MGSSFVIAPDDSPAAVTEPGGLAAEPAAEFVQGFARVWDEPVPDRFLTLFQPGVRLRGPLAPPTDGREEAREGFGALLRALPSLRADVHAWAPHRDGVFIEFEAQIGGRRPLRWCMADRFILRDGLAEERLNFADSFPTLLAALSRPAMLAGTMANGVRPRRPAPEFGLQPEQLAELPDRAEGGVQRFVADYSAHWAQPSPEGFADLLANDVALQVPLAGRVGGRYFAREAMATWLRGLPGVRGELVRWGARGDALFTELYLRLEDGRSPLRWRQVDRIRLRDGRAADLRSYYDSMDLLAAAMRRPGWWPAWLRGGLRPR